MAAQEVQSGRGQIYGVAPLAITPTGGSGAITGNISNMRWSTSWKEDEMASQNGATVESLIAAGMRRTLEFDFAPTSTTRVLALAECAEVLAMTPNQIVTITSEDIAVGGLNGTYNYKGGATITRTRDGVGVVGIKL
jgi:hypothetical protein